MALFAQEQKVARKYMSFFSGKRVSEKVAKATLKKIKNVTKISIFERKAPENKKNVANCVEPPF